MTTWQVLTTTWNPEPSVLLGCAALAGGYVAAMRPLGVRVVLFMAGILAMLLALVSPLDTLADGYLFSAHMLQHLLLVLVVPPLLLLGLPRWAVERALQWAPADRIERALGRPPVAWLLGMGTLWLWHAPALYDAALANAGVHVLQHLCFVAAATVFWWPLVAPIAERRRLAALPAVGYLLLAVFASSVLGIILTFARPGVYAYYLHPVDRLGILPLLRRDWGLSPLVDQQLGGLLMWVLSSPIYLLACFGILARWYAEPEGDSGEWLVARDQW